MASAGGTKCGAKNRDSDYLEERFRSYVETEEERLRDGLETVKYAIDGMDTLSLITGQGRIEKVSSLS